jgi:glycosyltransferase involved in cell wall biosynthesis
MGIQRLIEAVNFECGLLVSDAPENLDAISDYGFSFKNMDVDDLAGMLQHLVDNPEEVKSKARGGREYVRRRYGITSVVDGLEEIYNEMVNPG